MRKSKHEDDISEKEEEDEHKTLNAKLKDSIYEKRRRRRFDEKPPSKLAEDIKEKVIEKKEEKVEASDYELEEGEEKNEGSMEVDKGDQQEPACVESKENKKEDDKPIETETK